MIRLAARAQSLKPSPTLALAAKAKELAAQGKPVISLSVGEPDWDTFANIKLAGVAAIEAGDTKYAASQGLPELRRLIAQQTARHFGLPFTDAEVTVTAGAKMVIYSALQVLCQAGDEVIIPSPYWVSYPTMVELTGATPRLLPADPDPARVINFAALRSALSAKTKVLILNSPSNPTGQILSLAELRELAEILRKFPDVVILSDDIYNRLVFTGESVAPHLLMAAPDLRERTIVVNGASKSWSMTGWRLGWSIAPKAVTQAISNLLSQSVSCASPFTQRAALEGFSEATEVQLRRAVGELQKRRDVALAGLGKIAGLKAAPPQGAFYLWVDVREVLADDAAFAAQFLERHHVAVVPGVEFGAPGYLRMSFVVSPDSLQDALVRLTRFVHELKS